MTVHNGHDRITLLESLIREGLAEHFAAEVLGDAARGPYTAVLDASEARALWVDVYREHMFLQGEDLINPYQFGGGASGLPLSIGYSMGYHLVAWLRASHPEFSMSHLTALDAECFIPHFGAIEPRG